VSVRCQPITYLEAIAARRPEAPAVIQERRRITFAELVDLARRLAAAFRPGEVVGVRLPNVWQYLALELAIPLAGGIIMPLPLALGEAELRWARERAGAARLIDEAEAERLVAEAPRGAQVTPAPPDPKRVVEIALTSGTTGMPKLAALSAGLKQATFEAFTTRLEVGEEDRVLPLSPLTQGIGGMCIYCLRVGAALVMLGTSRFQAAHALRAASESEATYLVGVPTNVIRLLGAPELGRVDLGRLRVTAVAGAPMPLEVARDWEQRTGAKVVSFYGSMDAGQLAVGSPSDPQQKRWETVGRIHDCCEARVTPEGEICMRGPTVQERYWGESGGPYAEDGWAHMGDLGFIDDDGYLHVVGRLKDVIIRGGANINPYEVESALRAHPDVVDVCLVGRPDAELGERPHAFVVARRALGLPELRTFLEQRGLSRYKWPESSTLVDEIPLSGPGKSTGGC
jgi:acyl-CoA synthetase (AMP-forming)/AMP-acid ligase II